MGCWGDICDLSKEELEKLAECPECGAKIDEDGNAVEGCSYSPVECELCGWKPCDQSC